MFIKMSKSKIALVAVFFFLVAILATVALYVSEKRTKLMSGQGPQITISEPGPKPPEYSITPDVSDARVEIVRRYLSQYGSVLTPHAEYIVSTSDLYEIDFRLLVAIAQQESNLCKKIPPGSFNCWGWGIHSEGSLGFDSFEQAIKVVASGISSEYVRKGLDTPEKIMSKYTPNSNGSWAMGVSSFMQQMN